MTIIYPRELPDHDLAECTFDLMDNVKSSASAKGLMMNRSQTVDPTWKIRVQTETVPNHEVAIIAAWSSWKKSLRGLKTFVTYDTNWPAPLAYLSATTPADVIASIPYGNLLGNPGFELGATVWSGFGTGITITTVNQRTGLNGVTLDKGSPSGGTQRQVQQNVSGIIAGASYTVSAWIKGGGASSAGAYLILNWKNGSGTLVSQSVVVADHSYSATYAQISGSAAAPAGATNVDVIFRHATSGTSQFLIGDDLEFKLVTGAGFDGTATVNSLGLSGSLGLSDMPPGYQAKAGDRVGLEEDGHYGYYEVLENATANGSGVITLTVAPFIHTSVFTTSAVCRLWQPKCQFWLDWNSWSAPRTGQPGSVSFDAYQVL